MKNLKTLFILSALMLSLLIGVNNSSAATLAATLKGKILLQVEQNGEAWYVNPVNELRYYLGRPADAFNVMRELGLGISNKDFDSFNGYAPSRLSGRILLKVADSGKAYYVNTNDLKMYYLGRPADAFNVMRELGLGITDKNLGLIGMANNETASWQTYKDIKNGFELKYPANWQITEGVEGVESLSFSVRIFNSSTQKPETDAPGEVFEVYFDQTPCKASDWKSSGLYNYYKQVCIAGNSTALIIMGAFSSETKEIEDQILSTLKFTGLVNTTANWKTYSNSSQGASFKYPEKLSTSFIYAQAWPPSVKITAGIFSCNPTGETVRPGELKIRRTATSPVFCVESRSDTAAGTTYTDYSYTASYNTKLITFNFVIGYPNCDNYDNKTECNQERAQFNLDSLIGQIFSTFKFTN